MQKHVQFADHGDPVRRGWGTNAEAGGTVDHDAEVGQGEKK